MEEKLTTQQTIDTVNSYVDIILKEQAYLNTLYKQDWKDTYKAKDFIVSSIGELVELSDELKYFTKFFGGKSDCNFHLALEEFTDILHFMATRLLLEKYSTNNKEFTYQVPNDIQGFIIEINRNIINPTYSKFLFFELFLLGCRLFRVTPDLMLTAYLHKNSKNKIRAGAGALDFDVSSLKAKETPTYDYLFSSGFTSKHHDEFNASLKEHYEQTL